MQRWFYGFFFHFPCLLANAFALVGYPILPAQTAVAAVSTADHRYVIPGDFEKAPVFEVVSPPADA